MEDLLVAVRWIWQGFQITLSVQEGEDQGILNSNIPIPRGNAFQRLICYGNVTGNDSYFAQDASVPRIYMTGIWSWSFGMYTLGGRNGAKSVPISAGFQSDIPTTQGVQFLNGAQFESWQAVTWSLGSPVQVDAQIRGTSDGTTGEGLNFQLVYSAQTDHTNGHGFYCQKDFNLVGAYLTTQPD